MGTARRMGALVLAAALALAVPALAQDQRTLADVKAELTVLNGQIQQLRDELVRTGAAAGLPAEAATGLARLDQLEAELRFLTDRVDVLTNDVIRITEDAIEPRRRHRVPPDRARGRRHERQARAGAARRRGHPAPPAPGGGGGGAGRRRGAGGDRAVGLRRRGRRGGRRRQRQGGRALRRLPRDLPRRAALDRGAVPPRRGAGGADELARRGAQLPRRLQRRAAGPAWRRTRSTSSRSASASSGRPTRPA